MTFIIRTRKTKATDTRGARIRVETVEADGKAHTARTMAYDYAADNPHRSAVEQYLQDLGITAYTLRYSGDTRSRAGVLYRVVTPV